MFCFCHVWAFYDFKVLIDQSHDAQNTTDQNIIFSVNGYDPVYIVDITLQIFNYLRKNTKDALDSYVTAEIFKFNKCSVGKFVKCI